LREIPTATPCCRSGRWLPRRALPGGPYAGAASPATACWSPGSPDDGPGRAAGAHRQSPGPGRPGCATWTVVYVETPELRPPPVGASSASPHRRVRGLASPWALHRERSNGPSAAATTRGRVRACLRHARAAWWVTAEAARPARVAPSLPRTEPVGAARAQPSHRWCLIAPNPTPGTPGAPGPPPRHRRERPRSPPGIAMLGPAPSRCSRPCSPLWMKNPPNFEPPIWVMIFPARRGRWRGYGLGRGPSALHRCAERPPRSIASSVPEYKKRPRQKLVSAVSDAPVPVTFAAMMTICAPSKVIANPSPRKRAQHNAAFGPAPGLERRTRRCLYAMSREASPQTAHRPTGTL